MSALASPPSQDSIIATDPQEPGRRNPFYISVEWLRWILEALIPALAATSETVLSPDSDGGTLTNQNAAIAATPIGGLSNLGAGTYRVTYYARKTTVDGAASSLTVTIGWTDGGLAQVLSGPAMVVDTLTSPQSGSVMVTIDANSSLTYSTLYASTTPGNMRYKLAFLVEAV
jgi:hypothetical protein